MHIQVVISFMAIASAAAIALACDLLRVRNTQLRQTVAQMKTRSAGPGPGPKPNGLRGLGGHEASAAPSAPGALSTLRERPRIDALITSSETPHDQSLGHKPKKQNAALSAWLVKRAAERAAEKNAAESDHEVIEAHR